MERRLLFVQKDFLGLEQAKQSLEMVLAAASLEFSVSLFFIDDGVFQLMHSEKGSLSALFKALPFYDVQKIYVIQASLEARKLLLEDLTLPVISLLPNEVEVMLSEYDVIFS